jgi:nucleoside-diphosphate-sugar epimerase
MVYGPGAKGYLPQMIRYVQKNLFPPLSSKLTNKRSMVHVEDLVQAAIMAAEKLQSAGQVYIVSDGRDYTIYEIYRAIREALGMDCPRWHVPYGWLTAAGRIGDAIGRVQGRRFLFDSEVLQKLTGAAWYDTGKAKRELGFKPQWDLPSALPGIIEGMT